MMVEGTVFVTGATGNTGQYVVAELLKRGLRVSALSRGTVQIPGVTMVLGDLSSPDAFVKAAATANGIVHLASPRSGDWRLVISADLAGTATLISSWSHGSFVYASSSTVHGVPAGRLAEDTPISILNWYDMAKFVNEWHLASRPAPPGAAIALRPAFVFTANRRLNPSGQPENGLLGIIYEACQQGRTFLFVSDEGLETYGASYIGGMDYGRAVADSLGLTEPGPYELATGFVAYRAIIDAISALVGPKAKYVVRADGVAADGEIRLPQSRTDLDVTRFVTATGLKQTQDFESLIAQFVGVMQSGHR